MSLVRLNEYFQDVLALQKQQQDFHEQEIQLEKELAEKKMELQRLQRKFQSSPMMQTEGNVFQITNFRIIPHSKDDIFEINVGGSVCPVLKSTLLLFHSFSLLLTNTYS